MTSSGDDTISGAEGADTIFGYSGNDVLEGNAGDDFVSGGIGSDIVAGGTGDDTLLGGSGDDIIIGGDGADSLDGGSGFDVLYTTSGGNSLTGRSGTDIFVFEDGDETGNTVTDYKAGSLSENAASFNGDLVLFASTDFVATQVGDDVRIGGTTLTGAASANVTVLYRSETIEFVTVATITSFNFANATLTVFDFGEEQAFETISHRFDANGSVFETRVVRDNDWIERAYMSEGKWLEEHLGDLEDGRGHRKLFDTEDAYHWDYISEIRNLDGVLVDKRTEYDDGLNLRRYLENDAWYEEHQYTRENGETERTLYDDDNAQSWANIFEKRNVDGTLYDKRTTYDDGLMVRQIWDVEDIHVWEILTEHSADGDLLNKLTRFDDASTIKYFWDVDGTETWAFYSQQHNVDGFLFKKSITYDDGTTAIHDHDVGGNTWEHIVTHRETDGQIFKKVTTYYNGEEKLTLYDTDNAETWSYYTRILDANGNLINEIFG